MGKSIQRAFHPSHERGRLQAAAVPCADCATRFLKLVHLACQLVDPSAVSPSEGPRGRQGALPLMVAELCAVCASALSWSEHLTSACLPIVPLCPSGTTRTLRRPATSWSSSCVHWTLARCWRALR